MTSPQERTFNNFQLEDDPALLANGVVPEIAERLGFSVDFKRDGYGGFVQACGLEMLEAWDIQQAAALATRSGIQEPLNRSLWFPLATVSDQAPVVLPGANANLQDRAAQLVAALPNRDVFIPVGNRVMSSPTEINHPGVMRVAGISKGAIPTEQRYVEMTIKPLLEDAGKTVSTFAYNTQFSDVIMRQFVQENAELFSSRVAIALGANTGVQCALQMASAAGELPGKRLQDVYEWPGISVITDTLPLATTEQQLRNPKEYQNPYIAIRQIGVTAMMLDAAASDITYMQKYR